MSNLPLKYCFLLFFLLLTSFSGVMAQVITEGPDSVVVSAPPTPTPKDTIPFYRVDLWSQPGKAALLSGVLPGLGQAYNKSYWKIPVLYLGGGVLGYFLYTNHKEYLHYRKGVQVRTDGDSTNDVDRYTERLSNPNLTEADKIALLKKGRDRFRRWRDQNILQAIVAYTINVTEAYVYAHLKEFDISDDLSMRVRPDFILTGQHNFSPAFTLSINFKNNAHPSHRLR